MNVTVATSAGRVVGEEIADGYRFLGIPYAAPPVGPLRFRPPAPVAPWDGDRPCLERAVEQGEDALYLNVWTPSIGRGQLPVMFWTSMPGNFDGRCFARDGVVLVTASTRPMPFTSLCVGPLLESGAGNLQVLDQVAVLRWIEENIGEFGGDPDAVTVFGASHGGRNASALMVSPYAEGLVRRAIVMSTPRSPWTELAEASEFADRVLSILGIGHDDVDLVREIPAERFVAAATEAIGAPVFESFILDGLVMPAEPTDLAEGGQAKGLDLMTGYTADEARLHIFSPSAARRGSRRTDSTAIEADVRSWFASTPLAVDDVLAAYADEFPAYSRLDLLAAISTDHFRIAADRLALAQGKHHDKVFMYRFGWKSPRDNGNFGSYHYLDTHFAFDLIRDGDTIGDLSTTEVFGADPPDRLADTYHRTFVRFAQSGDPNGGGLPAWPTYNEARRPMMNFDLICAVIERFQDPLRSLWDGATL